MVDGKSNGNGMLEREFGGIEYAICMTRTVLICSIRKVTARIRRGSPTSITAAGGALFGERQHERSDQIC